MFKVTKLLILASFANLFAPSLASAEVYKWKDKNGVTRYSDVPPNDLPSQPLKPKKVKPANVKSVMPQANATDATATAAKPNEIAAKGKQQTQEEAANKRQLEAERAKKEAELKEAEQKEKDENCALAKQNIGTYSRGGRIARTNENGEKELLGDGEISSGLQKAKEDVEKYCN